jgi:hypothetical protein
VRCPKVRSTKTFEIGTSTNTTQECLPRGSRPYLDLRIKQIYKLIGKKIKNI